MDAIWNELKLMQELLAATVLSGLIGWQRERHGHNAGLRTHILVGVSAALFIVLSETLVSTFAKQDDQVRFDLIGVLGAVVSGVSFLGAGAIFSSKRGEGHQGTDHRCGPAGNGGSGRGLWTASLCAGFGSHPALLVDFGAA